jgi:3-hydroxyisobutyryl-CoA hydrolase
VGGGVGLAAQAPFRVVTDRTLWAMPETKIGYAPDVGASFFLHQLDGQLGAYLALTGETLTGRHALRVPVSPSRECAVLTSAHAVSSGSRRTTCPRGASRS